MIEQIQANGIFCTHMVDFCRPGHYVIYTIRRAVALVNGYMFTSLCIVIDWLDTVQGHRKQFFSGQAN